MTEPCYSSCPDCRCVDSTPAVPASPTRDRNDPGAATTAADITQNARRDAYGPPDVNHGRTATLWSAYLHSRGYPRALSAEDVCVLNVLQKLSRQVHAHSDDNLTDIIGYVLNIEEIRRAA